MTKLSLFLNPGVLIMFSVPCPAERGVIDWLWWAPGTQLGKLTTRVNQNLSDFSPKIHFFPHSYFHLASALLHSSQPFFTI